MTEGWRNRVVRLLDERGMTMKEASRRARRGETFVRDILKRGQTPSSSNLEGLAKVLNVSVAEILGDEQPGGQVPPDVVADQDTGADIRAQLAEVFADLVKANEETQRVALGLLRRTVYGPAKSRPTRMDGPS